MTPNLLLAAALLAISGCVPVVNRGYLIPEGGLILTEHRELIQAVCHDEAAHGCYDPKTRTIYCSPHDLATCGHELLHHVGLRHEEFTP